MGRTLIVTVGLPRSGKSTTVRGWGDPIVNGDSVRLALHGERFLAQSEPMVHVITQVMVEALFLAGHDAVVVDECNVTDKRRSAWERLAERLGAVVTYRIFDTSPAECKRRAALTDDAVIVPVIDRMTAEWDLPIPASWSE
jgi:predicted kinase